MLLVCVANKERKCRVFHAIELQLGISISSWCKRLIDVWRELQRDQLILRSSFLSPNDPEASIEN
jgi:hypothetical protein